MRNTEAKSNEPENDADKLVRLLDIELRHKRAGWRRAAQHRGTLRAVALLFLIAVIAGAVAAYFFLVTNNPRSERPRRDSPVPLPSP